MEPQTHAAAALCNLVLEFSAVKEAVVRAGGVRQLAGLTSSPHPALRLHALWALRNAAFKAGARVRAALMQVI